MLVRPAENGRCLLYLPARGVFTGSLLLLFEPRHFSILGRMRKEFLVDTAECAPNLVISSQCTAVMAPREDDR